MKPTESTMMKILVTTSLVLNIDWVSANLYTWHRKRKDQQNFTQGKEQS